MQKLKEFLYNPEEQKIPIGDKKNWFIVQKEEFVFADQDIKKLDNFIKECFKSLENWEQEILGKNKDNTKIQFMENIKENNSSLYALFDSVLALQKGYLDRSQEYFTDQKELNF